MKAALTAGVVVVALSATPAAQAEVRPINEGGDYRPCVTWDESEAVFLSMPMHRVQRIVDTNGERASRRRLGAAIQLIEDAPGPPLGRNDMVRAYPICDSTGYMFVAFNHKPRKRVTLICFVD